MARRSSGLPIGRPPGQVVEASFFGCCLKDILLAPMGVLAPMSAHAGLSDQHPIGTSGIFPVHVSAESPSNNSLNPLEVISEVSELYDKPF